MKTLLIGATLWAGLFFTTPTLHAQDIRVVSEEFPPYNYAKNGKFSGASTEVVMAVFEELRISPSIELKVLLKKRIDLWGMPELTAHYYAEKNGLNYGHALKKAYALDDVSRGGYYMAFNKQTPLDVAKRFEDALRKVKDNGTYQRIHDKYSVE